MNIYASKLYRTSPRKDRIRAAVNNPINSELVVQLKKYLTHPEQFEDPDEVSSEALKQKQAKESAMKEAAADELKDSDRFSRRSSSAPHFTPSSKPPISEKFSDELETAEAENASKLPDDAEKDSSEPKDDDVESSTKVDGSTIEASILPLTPEESTAETVESIKGTLNADESTSGVRYVSVKDNEAWIYYTDDVNLNNVMEAVIAKLQNSGYPHLEFNRLARSNNAIVFQILKSKLPLQVD